ncbi:MAG: aminotransferase class I/II-fold pyridoxal phosphate-dependent enzyme [Terricaulis sp.]
MPPKPLPAIAQIEPYRGGESVLPGIDKPIKLASKRKSVRPQREAKAAYVAAADKLHIYPEGSARKLREAIAGRYGLDAARIICGAGSDEFFFLLARAYLEPGDEIIVPEHSFSIYSHRRQAIGRGGARGEGRAYGRTSMKCWLC